MLSAFLLNHREKILKPNTIRDFPWISSFDHPVYGQFEVMQKLYQFFPDKRITRESIIRLYRREEWYAATMATLIWGGINASAPADKTKSNFYHVLTYPPELLNDHLQHILTLLEIGDLRKAFHLMQTEYKIPGVGYPFFTKLFHLLGESFSTVPIKPLLLDRWTTNAYYACLLTTDQNKLARYFPKQDIKTSSPGAIQPRGGRLLEELYESYVLDLRSWAAELEVRPSQIQDFMFGLALNKQNEKQNPRYQIWQLIKQHSH